MFNPIFSVSQKVLENIKKIEEYKTKLNTRRFPETILVEFERLAREVSSFSSTSIEGNPLPLTEVKKIIKNIPANLNDSEKEVVNYNEALLELNRLFESKQDIIFNLSFILKIHMFTMKDLLPEPKCGKLRLEPVFVNDPKLKKTVYWPPDQKDVPLLLNELLEYVQNNTGDMDPLLLAGIFHKQFIIIHPFIDGNGRTVRLATKALLAHMGLDTFNLFSFENYYNRNVSRYFQNVGVLGNYYDITGTVDFTGWLEYFTEGILDELYRVAKELEASSINPQTELKPYHKKIIVFIEKHGFIADRDYAKLTNRAKATRSLDFNTLIERGLIEKFGKARATYYKLKK
ncbi:MAG: Fic family protein [Elusimicrobia bacterium]|nr:Fic family protein [Candidatus Liberimonas magnetica]